MRILSTLAVKGVLAELLAGKATHDVVFEPTLLLMQRITRGETGDVAILTASAVDALMASGVLVPGSKRDMAISVVGIAVKAGAPKPDIATPEAVRALLLQVPSLCYSRSGASGLHFARVIQHLGIAHEVEQKATIIPNGFTAEAVADGRCVIAVQQVSELLVVPGIDVVGPLPDPIQEMLTFSAGIFTASTCKREAAQWLDACTQPHHAAAYARHGLRLASNGST